MKDLLPHQQRVVLEKEELDEKIGKLTPFLDSSIFQSLDSAEQGRLRVQLAVMNFYSQILGSRIDNF